jgi:glutathione synthase
MKLLFIADPLESFNIYKDSTFAMMREAQRRGHQIMPASHSMSPGKPAARCRPWCARSA